MNSASHVINDPIHGVMEFTEQEKSIVNLFLDSPGFQRLRHIKQLGMADMVFPGATHTRFNHCLGAAYVAKRIAQQIGLNEIEKNNVMVAALLHDIGHGPFSHLFESLLKNKMNNQINHEAWTASFLKDWRTKARQTGIDLSKLGSFISKSSGCELGGTDRLLADIVSSQLDADRLDYLLRDSHFCGVNYGIYDLKWILHCLTQIKDPKNSRLGIIRKGVGVVEHYLLARRLMTKNVYYHGKIKAAEFLMQEFLKLLSETVGRRNELAEAFIPSDLCRFLRNVFAFRNSKDETEIFCRRFVGENYAFYKQISDQDVWTAVRGASKTERLPELQELATALLNRTLPTIIMVENSGYDGTKAILEAQIMRLGFPKWKFWLHQYKLDSYKMDKEILYVQEKSGRVTNLSFKSEVIGALADRNEKVSFISVDDKLLENTKVQTVLNQLLKLQYVSSIPEPAE
jgi:uncharacterized protein